MKFSGRQTSDIFENQRHLLFIAPDVDDKASLVAAVKPGVEVIALDADRDGLCQIAETLANRHGVNGLHIVSHGRPGQLILPKAVLSLANLDAYDVQLRQLGRALSPQAGIFLYGCHVAADDGHAFVTTLAERTGAGIAASEHLVGAEDKGGDWNLGVNIGEVAPSTYPFQPARIREYRSVLTVTFNGEVSPAQSRLAVYTFTDTINYDDFATQSGTLSATSSVSSPVTYGITGGETSGNTVTYSGFWGTLTVNRTTGAYSYVPNDASLNAFRGFTVLNNSSTQVIATPKTGFSTTVINITATDAASSGTDTTSLLILPVGFADNPIVANPIPDQTATSGSQFTYQFSSTAFDAVDLSRTLLFSIVSKPAWLSFNATTRTFTGTPGGGDVGSATVTVRATTNIFGGLNNFRTVTDSFNIAVGSANPNSPPTITSNSGAASASINVSENNTLVQPVTATDPDAGNTLTYSISGGADAARFAINSSSGALSFAAAPNFEAPNDSGTNNIYDLIVQVSDGSLTDTQTIAVTVTNANEAPTITSNGGGASASINVAENSTAVTTVVATDPDAGATLTYSISGTDAASFTINASTGVLAFSSAPDAEAPTDSGGNNVYDLVVTSTDGSLSDTQTIAVSVTNVSEFAPSITSNGGDTTASISLAENTTTVTTVTATDADFATTLTYSVSGGADAAKFSINASTGVLAFVAAANFESPTDVGANNVYDVTVQVSDGSLSDSQDIAVTITDANDAPTITSNGGGSTASVSVAENGTAVTTVVATDDDAGATQTYSISGGADAAKFSINSSTGVLAFLAAPDAETPTDVGANNVYDVTVQVSDGTLTDTQSIAVSITNVSEFAPTITSNSGGDTASTSVAENSSAVTTVTATDADFATTLTYGISGGADAAKFSINSSTGVLAFVAAPNFESPTDVGTDNVYDVIVEVSDGSLTDAQTIAVTVTNVNETPTITSNGGGATASVNFAENATAVTTVTTTDPDAGATLTYSITGGADQAKFSIVSSTGALSFVAAPNFEAPTDTGTNNVYDVIVQVSDGSLTDAQTIAVTVTNVNEAPTITSGSGDTASVSVAENLTAVTTLTTTDPDAGAAKTFSLTGGADQAKFAINSSTGALSFVAAPNFEAPTDTGTNNVYDVIVQVSDGSLTDAQTIAVTVTNVNEAPTITSDGGGNSATVSVAENLTAVTTVATTDPDAGATRTFSLTGGADQAKFAINSSTGALSFVAAPNFEAPTDVGTNNVYDVIVQVSDGSLTDNQTIAVTVTNANEAPTITSGSGDTASVSVAENATAVTTLTTTDPDAGATKTFSLTGGADQAKFAINASTGALSFVAAPDFEAPTDGGGNNVYDLIVQVSDGSLTDAQTIAVTVTNANEAPTITSGSGDTAAVSVAENLTAVTTVTSTDPDAGATKTFSLTGGADQAKFAINSTTGALSFVAAPNFEAPTDTGADNIYDVIVRVSDGSLTDSQTVAVTVTNVNEFAPVISSNGGGASGTGSIVENSTVALTVTASDADAGSTLTYSVTGGADQASFTINASTGVVSFVAAPDFEAPIDSGNNNVYDLIVNVSDGTLSDTQTIALTITDTTNESPITISSNGGGATAAISIAENTTAVTAVTTTDPDPISTATFSLTGGADQAKFAINSSSGALTFVAAPNFEVPTDAGTNNVYDVIVQASDGIFTDTQTIAVTVTDANDAPTITSGSGNTASVSVAENLTAVTTVTTTDPDAGATKTFSLTGGADQAKFAINASTGALSFVSAPNFEAPTDTGTNNVYDVIVEVSDGSLTDAQTISVTVTNANEAPTITSGSGDTASVSIAENLTAVTTVTTTDPDASATRTFSLTGGADLAKFAIVSSTGALSFVAAPNFEAPTDAGTNNVYDVIVQVSDGSLTDAQTIAVTVTNANEAPTITSGSGDTAAVSVAENLTAVTTLTTTDPDAGATKTFSLTGGADLAKFAINASTGALSFVAAPNFEAPTDVGANNVYNVVVQVSDGSLTDAQTIAVTVTNANEAPTITSGSGDTASVSVAENLTAVTTLTTTDPDAGATRTFSLTGGADQAKFAINASTGALSFLAAPNFEVPTDVGSNNVYDVVVQVSDGSLTDAQTIAVTVTNANEAPTITSGSGDTASVSVAENATAVTTLTTTDPDAGATKTFSLTGGADQAKFTINAGTGALAFVAAPNFEAPTDVGANNVYNVVVQVSDGSLTDAQTIAVTVTNANEAPTITSGSGNTASLNVAENLTAISTVTVSDPDAGATKTFSLTGGADQVKFAINTSTGALSFVAAPNFESPTDTGGNNVYDVIVQVSDGSLTDSQTIAVSVTNVVQAITSDGGLATAGVAVDSGTTAVTTVTASDNSASRIFSLVGGADQAKFTINSTSGALSFVSAPNLASPTDVGLNNVYDVTVRVADGAEIDTQAIAVTVVSPNDPPVADDDSATTSEDAAASIAVLDGDTDPQGNQTITTVVLGSPTSTKGAALSVVGTSVSYTPGSLFQSLKAGEQTTDTFTYQARDNGDPALTSNTATVSVTITGANDAPTAVADALNVAEDGTLSASVNLLANDTDVDSGDTRSLADVGGSAGNIGLALAGQFGIFSVAADGTASYSLDNSNAAVQDLRTGQSLSETLNYGMTDAAGAASTSSVTVTIAGKDDAPVASDDGFTYVEGSGKVEIAVAELLGNDADVDGGDTISFVSLGTATSGAQLSVSGGIISYDPGDFFAALVAGQSGSDSFGYTIRDTAGNQATGSVVLTVLGTSTANLIAEEGQTFTIGDRTYELITRAQTWKEAKTLAESRGGQLASLATAAENSAVFNAFSAHLATLTGVPTAADGGAAPYLWIGANDLAKEGTFVWLDGSAFSDDEAAWGGSEPDNFTHGTLAPAGQDGVGLAFASWPQPDGGSGVAGMWNTLGVGDKLWSLVEYGDNSGPTQLSGLAGNDYLIDSGDNKPLVGNKGNDTYIVNTEGLSVVEKLNEGNDTVVTTLSAYTLGDHLERLSYTGLGDFRGTGNGLANVITGNIGNDTLLGEGGADTLVGAAGNDSLVGGLGGDRMEGGLGDDNYDIDNALDRLVELVGEGSDTAFSQIRSFGLAGFAQVENLRFTGSGNFTGAGNALDNDISGGAGNDTVSGAAGNDTLSGLAGNDLLNGGIGDDLLLGDAGNDSLTGGDTAANVGTDTVVLAGNRAEYTFSRVTNSVINAKVLVARTVDGLTETDTLIGIERVRFADSLTDALLTTDDLLKNTGSPFADTYLDDDATQTVVNFSGLAGNDSITGGARANVLDGGDGNDTMAGGGGDDTLVGGAGNDTLDGGSGNDTINGGLGNDIHVVDSADDVVAENLNQGSDTIRTTLAGFTLAANFERLEFTGSGGFAGTGNELGNVIVGLGGNDSLSGLAGVDTLIGGDGNDSLDGGTAADRLDGGLGDDSYFVDNALDLIVADGGGHDLVRSSVSRTLTAGLDDLLLLETGASLNLNGSGNADNNVITGNSGNNVLSGAGGNDILGGGDGNDTVNGGAGDDLLTGDSGNDTLNGDAGADTLLGGAGRDVLNGGGGSDADRFIFSFADLPTDAAQAVDPAFADRVLNFQPGTDKLALGGFDALQWDGNALVAGQFLDDPLARPTPGDADDHLLYDRKTGQLWYDADGSGDGAAILIAVFGNAAPRPVLTEADFTQL